MPWSKKFSLWTKLFQSKPCLSLLWNCPLFHTSLQDNFLMTLNIFSAFLRHISTSFECKDVPACIVQPWVHFYIILLQSRSDTEGSRLHLQGQRKGKICTSRQCIFPFRLKIMCRISSPVTWQNISGVLCKGRWVIKDDVLVLCYLPCDTAGFMGWCNPAEWVGLGRVFFYTRFCVEKDKLTGEFTLSCEMLTLKPWRSWF